MLNIDIPVVGIIKLEYAIIVKLHVCVQNRAGCLLCIIHRR